MDGHEEELAPITILVQIYRAMRGCYETVKDLLFTGTEQDAGFKHFSGRVILGVHAIKRESIKSRVDWEQAI